MTETDRDYILALHYWRHDEPLPLDLAARLMEAGYDVEKLERKYRA